MPLAADVDISRIARDSRMQSFSGADCAGLCRDAAMFCIKGNLGSDSIDTALVSFELVSEVLCRTSQSPCFLTSHASCQTNHVKHVTRRAAGHDATLRLRVS
jgi:SpoVK/Ycf46/Vps4 family AAA+-type ATPase